MIRYFLISSVFYPISAMIFSKFSSRKENFGSSALSYRTNGRRLQGAVIHKTPPASCHGNRGRCGFMGNASGAAKPQCSRELTHARAAVLAWSLLYIFRVVLYTFWLMALLALVAAACLASSVSAAATAAFISA